MLLHLNIRNVAIIEESSFSLDEGLNVFTGETGAGKSILIDSLGLTLGGRANSDLVRTGAEEASVSALFAVNPELPLVGMLQEAGIPVEEELVLRRSITATGRSRAYINQRPVTVTFLREIGRQLCEISGQHEHQHLLHPKFHLGLLDAYGELIPERDAVTEQYNAVRDLRKELEHLGGDAQNRARRRGYLQYQIDELEEADLDVEEEELEHQRRYMMQIEQMIEASQSAEAQLYSAAHSILERLGKMQTRLANYRELSDDIDMALKSLEEGEAFLDDASRTLRHFAEDAVFDANELEALQARLTHLRDLKRKHGVQDIQGLKRALQEYTAELADLDRREARMESLEANYHTEVETLQGMARALSTKRRGISQLLAKDVESELASLGMKKATFLVEMTEIPESEPGEEPAEIMPSDIDPDGYEEYTSSALSQLDQGISMPGPTGYDQAQFLLSSNPGEEPRAMHRIASGGELSRIMLAIKQVAAERDPVPTCIFDEVDAGIGGVAAATIGHKIHEIANTRQVLCITHLPQIACYAKHHFHIEKMEEEGRTHSVIQALKPVAREREIARMLGGMQSNQQSLAHARELLSLAQDGDPLQQNGKEKTKKKHAAKNTAKNKAKTKKASKANGVTKESKQTKSKVAKKTTKKSTKKSDTAKETKRKSRTSKKESVNGTSKTSKTKRKSTTKSTTSTTRTSTKTKRAT